MVGGGIIGAGVARDLAQRGFAVGLVERADLASGTTSRPTRLIHGGLRYLELLDFGLVRADMREREVLMRIAPHLVQPLPFFLPIYEGGFVYRQKLRLGMRLYDALSFDKSLPKRQWVPAASVVAAEPGIRRDGLHGAWRFYDAQVSLVERLVVENALDAAAHGAHVLTHAPVERFLREGGRVSGAAVRDALSGGSFEVRARCVVNAAGPWIDEVAAELRPRAGALLRLTKGVHVVTPEATRRAYVLFAPEDGRLFFVIPWLGMSLLGTTDTDYHGDPAAAAATDEDVRYLTRAAREAFPEAPLDRILYTYAGVRALVREEGVEEGDVSRKHGIYDHQRRDGVAGVITVVGGKLTGYRGIAEEVADAVGRKLGRRVRSRTGAAPLPGGGADPRAVLASLQPRGRDLGVSGAALQHLARVYGALAASVLDLVAEDRSLAAPVCAHQPDIAAQLVRAVRFEWAATLGDVLLRRTPVGLGPCQALDRIDGIADHIGALLGWSRAQRAAQIAAYEAELAPMRAHSTERAHAHGGGQATA